MFALFIYKEKGYSINKNIFYTLRTILYSPEVIPFEVIAELPETTILVLVLSLAWRSVCGVMYEAEFESVWRYGRRYFCT